MTVQLINKPCLRDMIAATGLVTLFGLCDLEIEWMSLKNSRASLNKLELSSANAQIGSKSILNFANIEIPIIKIRRSRNRLIFIVGIPIP